jgi:hypothetical protein
MLLDNPGFASSPPSPVIIAVLAIIAAVVTVVAFTVILIRTRMSGFAFGFSVVVAIAAIIGATVWTMSLRDDRGSDISNWLMKTHGISITAGEAIDLLEGGKLIVEYMGHPECVEFVATAGDANIVVYSVDERTPLPIAAQVG